MKLDNSLFVFNVYVPPTSSNVLNDRNIDFYEEIEKCIEQYSLLGKPFITGDLNSRTAHLIDYIKTDPYLDSHDNVNNDQLFENDIPLRVYCDHVVDSNGRKLISLCKSTNHVIANGRLHKDKQGTYTFCSPRDLSVTDYLLLNVNDVQALCNFEVLEFNEFSDHSPLYFCFKRKKSNTDRSKRHVQYNSNDNIDYETKIVFHEQKLELFKQSLLNTTLHQYEESSVSEQVDKLTTFLHRNAEDVFGKKFPTVSNPGSKTFINKPKWFDNNCYNA